MQGNLSGFFNRGVNLWGMGFWEKSLGLLSLEILLLHWRQMGEKAAISVWPEPRWFHLLSMIFFVGWYLIVQVLELLGTNLFGTTTWSISFEMFFCVFDDSFVLGSFTSRPCRLAQILFIPS